MLKKKNISELISMILFIFTKKEKKSLI